GTYRGDGLDRDHRVDRRAALAAVGFRARDPEQPLRRHELGDIPGIVGRVRALARAGGEMLLGEAAHRIAELLLLGRETKVHGHPSCVSPPWTRRGGVRSTPGWFDSCHRTTPPPSAALLLNEEGESLAPSSRRARRPRRRLRASRSAD